MPQETLLTIPDTKPERHHRKLEDLNLLDDFLFRQMLLQEDTGEEFCRILLHTILGKPIRKVHVVPQKDIPGIDTHQHGIRLDAYIEAVPEPSLSSERLLDARVAPAIYDIEPNKYYEKETLPRRMRYYHGLIDTRLLASDMSYESLPEVVIITILPYDPFEKNRMVYTIQNQCVEDALLPYDDGAKKIFLYTRGTEGNPSQKLRDMLRYIEETTENNVTNQEIAAVENLVNKVKRRREVNISYMKSWEWERMVREEAEREGRAEGLAKGRAEGLAKGRAEGLAEGRAEGHAEGRAEGIELGRQEGLKQGIKIFLDTCRELGASQPEAYAKLTEKYHLSADEAEKYLNQYWI